MADELETLESEPEQDAEEERAPLGLYAPFDVSDQKEWTKADLDKEGAEDELRLAENIKALVRAACQRESLARRLEVSRAWFLQLLDRGFHKLVPDGRHGWSIFGATAKWRYDIYGAAAEANLYDFNVIGVHNDIIVNALNREPTRTEFSPKQDNDQARTAAAQGNKIKFLIAEDACYREAQRKAAREFCTGERAVFYMRPVADAQRFGFEDDNPDVVPENETEMGEAQPSKTPRIQTVLNIYGKLEHKGRIAQDESKLSPYQIIAEECDTASMRAEFPWIADEIEGGGCGIAEIELDRVARAAIKIAIAGGMQTGQAMVADTTKLRAWILPEFYYDRSCSKEARAWLLENFPKGFLAVYAGKELGFVRNEAWTEVLTIIHARSGKGQNRRALTEAYSGPNLILNNLVELIVKFFTSTVPRVFYDSKVFNVPQLRTSGNTPGRKEPFYADKVTPNSPPILQDPMPTHQPSLPEFIQWLAGPLAQEMTGAQLTLQGAQVEGEQGTLGEAKMDNASAMTRLSEPWSALCEGFSSATLQAVKWNARVQPKGKVFDRVTKDQGRIRVEMKDLDSELLTVTETNAEFPESWTDREERVWQLVSQMPQNGFIATMMTMPDNARILKDAAKMGLTIPGAASWEKQEGELAILLAGKPQPNPQIAVLKQQIAQLQAHAEQGVAEMQANGVMQPEEQQGIQQGLAAIAQLEQQLQQLPPLVSSVPVRGDGSEEDGIEAACCLAKMISPEGRRLASSEIDTDQWAFQNLHLHWNEHRLAAQKLAAMNQKPIEPKVSITADLSKAPPAVQQQGWQAVGIAVSPDAFAEMGPHLITHEVEGVGPSGAKEKVKTELAGKQLD